MRARGLLVEKDALNRAEGHADADDLALKNSV